MGDEQGIFGKQRRRKSRLAADADSSRASSQALEGLEGTSVLRSDFAPPVLLASAAVGVLWALSVAPHAAWGLAALLGTATLLDLLAGDVLRAGRRIVAPGLVVGVAAFVLFGTPAAVLVGCARGIVRVLSPRPMPLSEASCILATAVLGPLLGGLSANALSLYAPAAWLSPVVYIAGAYTIEAGATVLLLSRISRPSLRLSFEQTFGWTMLQFAVLGALGVWLGHDLAAGHWLTLAYFAVPMAVVRHGFSITTARDERYVAALELENTHLFDKIGQLDRITGDLADAVAMAIDGRDGVEQDHSHRVARLSTAIGASLGISGADLEILRRGALLHDVGTLAVPANLFSKTGPLTPTERRQMQLHAEFGARFVGKWRDCPKLATIIEQHHERLDGSGYPRRLAGEQIVLEARIVGAAEAYVALTSNRPQRPAYSHEEAVRILRERTPSEYDPAVIDALSFAAGARGATVLPLPVRRNGA
jgi:putative nucleotidyltransferase with HDIG domain